MEFSNTHMTALNLKLPVGFLFEPVSTAEPRPKRSESSRLSCEVSFPSTINPVASDRVDPPKPPKPEGFRKVYTIMQKLKNHPSIGPFLQPVDRNKVPDYYNIIHCPIDLSVVEKRLIGEEYASSREFAADIRKMWSNSFLYNQRGTDIYIATIELSAYFENLIKGNEDVVLRAQPRALAPRPQEQEYSEAKRRLLGSRIKMLQPKFFKGVYDIVKNSTGAGEKGDEFEFDIELLPSDICRRLEDYTNECLTSSIAPPVPPRDSDSSDSDDSPEPLGDCSSEAQSGERTDVWPCPQSTSF